MEVICGSSIILQVVDAPLWNIFALLNVARLHKYLDLVTFLHYNCLETNMLMNIFYLPVILLCLYLQLGYLLLAHHALQYLHLNNQRWFGRFVHHIHNRRFISPTWTHLQIIPNTRTILHEYNISHEATHVQMHNLQKLSCLPLLFIGKHPSMLFILNASFTN